MLVPHMQESARPRDMGMSMSGMQNQHPGMWSMRGVLLPKCDATETFSC